MRKTDYLMREIMMSLTTTKEILAFLYEDERLEIEELNTLLDEAICRANLIQATLKLIKEEQAE